MAKIKSIITEAEINFMKDVEVEFVSLVGHAANRQPFKIIKGEVIKGDNAMPKKQSTVFWFLRTLWKKNSRKLWKPTIFRLRKR
jgi:hypothetical protein